MQMTSFHKHLLTLILLIVASLGIQAQSSAAKTAMQSKGTKTITQTGIQSNMNQISGQSYMKEITIDHPIYIGFLLIDEPTVETMTDLCEYYGLTPEETTDGYTAYRASDSTLLRFKQSEDPTAGVNGNLIEIQTRASQKTLSKILSSLNFNKANKGTTNSKFDAYDKGSTLTRSKIRCFVTPGSPRTLTFRSIGNNNF